MCGRFTRMYTWAQLHALYMLSQCESTRSNLQPRYNICPTTQIDAVIEQNGERALVPVRWGLIPRWWKKTIKELPATFNARSDTVADKPMYRDAFRHRRCILPASGYYEWRKGDDGGREPHYFTRTDGKPLSLAGLSGTNGPIPRPARSCAPPPSSCATRAKRPRTSITGCR